MQLTALISIAFLLHTFEAGAKFSSQIEAFLQMHMVR